MTEDVFVSSSIRPGHPAFLDLPWGRPLSSWRDHCARLVDLPSGEHRHPVVFVGYEEGAYALKELPPGVASREYEALRGMQRLGLPTVEAVGHLETAPVGEGPRSVVVTRYLDRSLPYHLLFQRGSLSRYREGLLDAMASLLVQLHVAGVYWGDCSLYNTLFRRDAGTLQAYLVDAETSEVHAALADGLRNDDLDIAEENVCGALADLEALGMLPDEFDVFATGAYLRQRYEELWGEVTREETLDRDERYRIQERVRALNALGFSVAEVEMRPAEGGRRLHLRAVVTDRHFHRNLLHTLAGIDAEERQARQIVNEIQERKAWLARERNRSTTVSVAAFDWLSSVYHPALERLRPLLQDDADPVELYCELLEHKWYLSEAAQRDVGHEAALDDYLRGRAAAAPPPERAEE